ncbi:MAG TPA: DUF6174 domain-containing protein [Marinagarivorans sp.]
MQLSRSLSRHLMLCTVTCTLIAGCDNDESSAENVLAENQTLWTTFEDGSYEYDIYKSSFTPYINDFHATVVDGDLISSEPIYPEDTTDRLADPRGALTMDELFETVRDAQANDTVHEVTYNADYGFPESISIDPIVGAIDDEYSYSINNFQPLEPALAQLLKQQKHWQDADISAYTMELNISCFCSLGGIVNVVIEEGEAVSGQYVAEDRALNAEELGSFPATVQQLFATAEQALRADELTVEMAYDEDLGYPTEVKMSLGPDVQDGPASYYIRNLTPAGSE